jgi:hypothetical protein
VERLAELADHNGSRVHWSKRPREKEPQHGEKRSKASNLKNVDVFPRSGKEWKTLISADIQVLFPQF